MSVVSTFDIYISHVESDGPLLKLWVQQDRQSVVLIEQYIAILRQHFETGKGVAHHSALTTGKVCCSRYSDGEYYRARITNLSNIAQGKVTVHFIDYGNSETVLATEIRLLELFDRTPLNSLSDQAEEFYLAGVVPSAGVWEDDVLKYIKKKVCYVELKGTVVARFGNKKMLKILVQNEDFGNFLISQGICHAVMLQAQQAIAAQRHQIPMFAGFTVPPPVVQQGPYAMLPSKMVPPPVAQPQQPVQQKSSLIFTSPLLEINSQHEIFVSYVEDGPISFTIQLKENEPILAKLMDTIKSLPQVTVLGPLMPGSVCLGRYSSDKMLCRAVVTSVQADSCKVYYVDFGNSEILPYSEIFSIPNDLVEPKVMALRFTLYAVKDLGEITDDVKEVFSELVTNKLLVMRVTPSDGPPLKQYCELFDGGRNIKELIMTRMKLRRKVEGFRPAPLPKVGQSVSVVVSFVEMPSSFNVQYERTSAQLASLMTAVQAHCASATPVPRGRLRPCLPCCAPYSEDGQWYRAQVISLEPSQATVLYVDYGNTDVVLLDELREISSALAEALEPQALRCCLKGFQGDILSELTNTFEQLVLDKVLRMVVVEIVDQVAVVELYDEALDIGAHLLCPPQPPAALKVDIPAAGDNGWPSSEGVLALVTSPQDRLEKNWSGGREQRSSQRPPRYQQQQFQRDSWQQDRRRKPRFENAEQDSSKKDDGNKAWQKCDDEKPWQRHDRDGDEKPWQKRERDDEKPWQKRDRDGEDKPSWQKRNRDGEDKPWQKRDRDGEDKPWQKRDRDGEDKPWQKRDRDGEDKPWQKRDRDGEDKPWQKRDRDGEDKPSWQKRDRDGDDKSSWQRRGRDGDDKPSWQKRDRDDKPSWQRRDRDGEDKPSWQKRDRDNDDKPSWQKRDDKPPWQKRDREGEDKPWQKRDREGEDKPWQKRDREGEDKPWQKRDRDGEEKPWQKRDNDRKWGNRDNGNDKGRGSWVDRKKQWAQDGGSGRLGRSANSGTVSDRLPERSVGGQSDRGSRFQGNDFSAASSAPEEQWGDDVPTPAPMTSVPVLYGRLTPPTVAVGATKIVKPVFITNPHDFCVQVMPDSEPLDNLMARIAEVYGGGEGTPVAAPQAGTTCIAKYSDDQQWYRAVVQNVSGMSALVLFPDYGNKEDVPLLELVEMDAEFEKLPVQGVRCSLAGALPQGPAWTDDDISSFTAATDLDQLEATFIRERDGCYEVLLKDITSGQIINVNYGGSAVTTMAPLQAAVPGDYVGPGDTFPELEIAAGMTTDVVVPWFINPEEFYCQLASSESELKTMMKELQVAYASWPPKKVSLEVGCPVVVKFKSDGVLYRACLESSSWDKWVIQYVDYGNKEEVVESEVLGLERRFLTMPRQAVLCSLRGVKPACGTPWPLGPSLLDKCFEADTLQCTFHELSEQGTYMVTLKRGDQDIAQELVEKGFAEPVTAAAATPEPEEVDLQLLVGTTLRANISFVERSSRFFVHLDLPSVDHIQSLVWGVVENPQGTEPVPEENLVAGTMCIATPDSESWYRGRVVGCPDAEGVTVEFVDYGDQHVVPRDKVLLCPAGLAELPRQSVACCLRASDALSQELEDQFKAELEAQDVILLVEDCLDGMMSVLVFDVCGKVHSFLKEVVEAPCELELLCPFLVTKAVHVWVSHVSGAESIWLQRTQNEKALSTLVEKLFTFYETEAKGVDTQVTAGMLCAAKSPTDGNWYRARVVSAEGEAVNVVFLDYGNREDVLMASVKALDEAFYVPNVMAVSVALPIIPVIAEEELVNKITELTSEKDFTALFSRDDSKLVADLVKDCTSISKQLSELGAANLLLSYSYIAEETVDDAKEEGSMVFVSFIESPVDFWVQVASNATAIECLQCDLQSADGGLKIVDELPSVGDLLAMMFSDDSDWYRVKVTKCEATKLTVCFVDYGNVEEMEFTAGKLKHLPENLKELPHFATRCKFDLIPVVGNEWSTEALERFENMIETGGPFVIKTLYEDDVKHVEMFLNGTSIVDVLVSEGLAMPCASVDAIPERPSPFGSNREQVFVSYGSSPSRFWVQRMVDSDKIDGVMQQLSEAEDYLAVDEVLEGEQLVAAQHEDGLWYRAHIISSGDETRVLFVDYGNEESVSAMKLLPVDLQTVPPLARACSLQLPTSLPEWPSSLDPEFEALVEEGVTRFEMEVVQEGDPSTVILYLDGKPVSEILLALCEPDNVQIVTMPTSEVQVNLDKNGVCVSYSNSPSDFWVQNASSEKLLLQLDECLAGAEGFPELHDITEGKLCVAKFEEVGIWYRARVLGTVDEGTSVLFVDYGNTEVCQGLRALPADLEQLAPLAQRCQLLLLPGASGWSQLACETFLNATSDTTKVFQLEVVEDDDPMIVKLSHDGKDIFDGIAVDSLIIPDTGSDDDILELEAIKIQLPMECDAGFLHVEATSPEKSDVIAEEVATTNTVHKIVDVSEDVTTAMLKNMEGDTVVSKLMSSIVENAMDSIAGSHMENPVIEKVLPVSDEEECEGTVDHANDGNCNCSTSDVKKIETFTVNVAETPEAGDALHLFTDGSDVCVGDELKPETVMEASKVDTDNIISEIPTEYVDMNAAKLVRSVVNVDVFKTESEDADVHADTLGNFKLDVEASKLVNEEDIFKRKTEDVNVNTDNSRNLKLDVETTKLLIEEDISSIETEGVDVNAGNSGKLKLNVETTKSVTEADISTIEAEAADANAGSSGNFILDVETSKLVTEVDTPGTETANLNEGNSGKLTLNVETTELVTEGDHDKVNSLMTIAVAGVDKSEVVEQVIVQSETPEGEECISDLEVEDVDAKAVKSGVLGKNISKLMLDQVSLNFTEQETMNASHTSDVEVGELKSFAAETVQEVGLNGVSPLQVETPGSVVIEQQTIEEPDSGTEEQDEEAEEYFEDAVGAHQRDVGDATKRASSPGSPGQQTQHLERIVRDISVEMKTPSEASPTHVPNVIVEFKKVPSRPGSPRYDNTERILPGCFSGNVENGS